MYLDCFDTIEQLADWGLSDSGKNATETCRRRAHEAIAGTTRFENHLYYNLPRDARVITMRTEHLIQDWKSAELAVGGEDYFDREELISIPRINTGSTAETKYLGDDNLRMLVCKELCNEIQVYKRILNVSINLSKDQVNESMEELKLSCPVEAASASCPTPLPDITEKLIGNRGYDKGLLLDAFTGSITVGRSVHGRVPLG